MQGPENGDRSDGGAGEIGRDILRDAGEAKDVDVQQFAGLPSRFEIRASVVAQTEVQAFAGCGLFDHVGMVQRITPSRPGYEHWDAALHTLRPHPTDASCIQPVAVRTSRLV